eukprot:TRINITY_DN46283_c0_g1_i1.p1 TRINITY_DN46283_c0_g1~~TRINITY_DN46283_c0_g1_i1.p1  ORF type:complete len:437 (+),score=119.83 TRINITY_DN46283_c0_g1_i1:83-1393(+)
MLPAGQVITRKLAAGAGPVKVLPCLKSGSFLVAGGLPWTTGLPWLENMSKNLHLAETAEGADAMPHLVEARRAEAVAASLAAASSSTLPPGLRLLESPRKAGHGVSTVGPLEILENALQERLGTSTSTTSTTPFSDAVVSASGRQTPVSDVSREASAAGLESEVLLRSQQAALQEIAKLRDQRRKFGLAKVDSAIRWTQQTALRAWMSELRQVKRLAAQEKQVRDAAARGTTALRRQYKQQRLANDIQSLRKLRHTSFRAWALVAHQRRLEAKAAAAVDNAQSSTATELPPLPMHASDAEMVSPTPSELSRSCNGTSCSCGGGSWGCQTHRMYSGSLLLAHRQLTLRAFAKPPPGLSAPPGLTPMWSTQAVPAKPAAAETRSVDKELRRAAPKSKAKATASKPPAKAAATKSQKALETDFHQKPLGVWATKAMHGA